MNNHRLECVILILILMFIEMQITVLVADPSVFVFITILAYVFLLFWVVLSVETYAGQGASHGASIPVSREDKRCSSGRGDSVGNAGEKTNA